MSSTKITKLCATAGAVGGLALAAGVISASCSQPRMWCTSAHGDFAVKFNHKGGDESGPCGTLIGDVVGLDTYAAQLPDGNPDFSMGSVGISSSLLGTYYHAAVDQGAIMLDDGGQTPVAFGKFDQDKPAGDDFCTAKSIDPAEIALDEIDADPTDTDTTDEDFPGQDATDMKLEWEDFRVYVTPDAQGTQFVATLNVDWNGCSATYEAVGVYPAVGCESDDDCGDTSGINPSFAVECDDDLGMCVLSKDPPSYE